jgi:hypothetical protein
MDAFNKNSHERSCVHIDLCVNQFTEDILNYTAGFIDSDGCFKINKDKQSESMSVSVDISQALKGIEGLYFIYDHFGGSINLQLKETDKYQSAYAWSINGEQAILFANLIKDYLLLKKREAIRFSEFPYKNIKIIPIIATNKLTNETSIFKSLKDCKKHFNRHLAFKKQSEILFDNWCIKKSLSKYDISIIKKERINICLELKKYKQTPHNTIDCSNVISHAYFAGFFDGDGKFNTFGKSGQNHSITQKYPEICNLFKYKYGGTVYYRKGSDTWTWEIYTDADKFLNYIAPYIVGKKKQCEVIINMKPGDGQITHALLRTFKATHNALTPLIDKINDGNKHEHKTPVKTLPKGVFKYGYSGKPYIAQIQYNKAIYKLGLCDTICEAEELYNTVHDAIMLEKRGGPKADLNFPVIIRK